MVKEQRKFNVTVDPTRTNYYDRRVDLKATSENEGAQFNLVLNDCRWPIVLEDFKQLHVAQEVNLDGIEDALSENCVGSFSVMCTRIDLTAIGFRLASRTPDRELASQHAK
jgi:hypothetical protein